MKNILFCLDATEVCDMNRQKLLEQKRRQIITDLETWAQENNLLGPGEKIVFEIRVEQTGLVVEFIGHKYFDRTYNLLPEDWRKITSIYWPNNLRQVIDLLKIRNNKPIFKEEIENSCQLKQGLNPAITRRINTHFSEIEDYDIGKQKGVYYSFGQVPNKKGCYAIKKTGYF